jgi:hypothetical protein
MNNGKACAWRADPNRRRSNERSQNPMLRPWGHPSAWFKGPYAFVLRNARPLPFRVSPGRLSFFDVPQL